LKNIILSIEKKLGNAAFTEKAPAQVVEGARRQLADNLSKRQETEEALKALNL
jgi:valyl-tRNA synthetase